MDFALSLGAQVLAGEPMSRHTTFGIGGPAEYFVTPRHWDDVRSIMDFGRRSGMPVMALGNGSNLLVSDRGIAGAVLYTGALRDVRFTDSGMECGAGLPLREACELARDHGLTGLEFAYGIPGTVGGAVYMNAGAYGGEMKDVVARAEYFGADGAGELSGDALAFEYRTSAFTDSGRLITRVTFRLLPGERGKIDSVMQELMGRRRSKQPLELPSAGSVFRRPPGHFAGTLIESCGLKGLRIGGAEVSVKHAGFIVNVGGATCADVLALIARIQQEVSRQTGVRLEPEIRVVGN